MATTAVVSLTVDETGGTAGFTRFEAAANKSVANVNRGVQGLAQRLAQARKETEQLGNAGTQAGEKISQGIQRGSGHALSMLDVIRLLRDDLGVRIPRAMEKLISQTQTFQKIATIGFGTLAAVGAFELVLNIVKEIGTKISEWGHFLAGDTKEMQSLYQSMVKANNELLAAPHGQAQYMQNLAQVKKEIADLEAKGLGHAPENLGQVDRRIKGIVPITSSLVSKDSKITEADEKRYQDLLAIREQMSKKQTADNLSSNEEIRKSNEELAASALEGYNRVAQERKNALADIDYRENNRAVLGDNGLDKDKAHDLRLQVEKKASVDLIKLNQETSDKLTELWNQANLSRVNGEARAYMQMQQEQARFETQAQRQGYSHDAIEQGRRAIEQKYLNEYWQRRQDVGDDLRRMEDQNNAAALDGTAKLYAEEKVALDQLVKERRKAGEETPEFDKEWESRASEVRQKTTAELHKALDEYAQASQSLHDRLQSSSSHGYEQIAAELQQKIDEEQKVYAKIIDGLSDTNDPDHSTRNRAAAQHKSNLSDIDAEGQQKILELTQRNAEQTQEIEERAMSVRSGVHKDGLLGILDEEHQATAKITAEYQKSLREWQKACDEKVLRGQQAADRLQAIDDLYNAQMEEQQKSLQDKLAGEIEGAFKNPMGALKSAMEHEMAEIIANWIMQLQLFKPFFQGAVTAHPSIGGVGGGTGAQGGVGGLLQALHGAAGRTPPFMGGSASVGGYSATGGYSTAGSSTMQMAGDLGVGGRPQAVSSTPVSVAAANGPSVSSSISSTLGDARSLMDRFNIGKSSTSPMPGASTADDLEGLGPEQQASAESDSALSGIGGAPTASSALTSAMGLAGTAMAGYQGAEGVLNSFHTGGLNGALSGTMSGVALGAAIGSIVPGLGTVVGGIIGGAAGLTTNLVGDAMGESGKFAARDYYKQTLLPQLEMLRNTDGGGDYLTQISQANKDAADGMGYMSTKFSMGAAQWVDDNYLKKELADVSIAIQRRAGSGSADIGRSAKEFHTGGYVDSFGDLATSSTEGFAHLERGEMVMDRASTSAHAPTLNAMRGGASPADIARMYLGDMRGPSTTSSPQAVGDNHSWDVKAIDAKSFRQFLDSGGNQEVVRSVNRFTGSYAGDGQV